MSVVPRMAYPSMGFGSTTAGCVTCKELHDDIRLSVAHLTHKLDSFFMRMENLVTEALQTTPQPQSETVTPDHVPSEQTDNNIHNLTKSMIILFLNFLV